MKVRVRGRLRAISRAGLRARQRGGPTGMVSLVPVVAARLSILAPPLLYVVKPRAGVVIASSLALGERVRALSMPLALLEAAFVTVAIGVPQRACNHMCMHMCMCMCMQYGL